MFHLVHGPLEEGRWGTVKWFGVGLLDVVKETDMYVAPTAYRAATAASFYSVASSCRAFRRHHPHNAFDSDYYLLFSVPVRFYLTGRFLFICFSKYQL